MEFMIVSEACLPRLFWRVWRKKPTCVVQTVSLFRGKAATFLERTVEKLRAKGSVTDLCKDHEDRLLYPFVGDLLRCTNVFAESEAWMEKTFRFDTADSTFGRYASAYRHVCASHVFNYYERAYLIHGLEPGSKEQEVNVTGGDALDVDFNTHQFGVTNKVIKRRLRLDRLVNVAQGFGVLGYSVGWVLRHVRLKPPVREKIFLGSDFVGSGHDNILWNELDQRDKSVLVVLRSKQQIKQYGDHLEGTRYCSTKAGYFSILGGMEAIWELLRDVTKLSLGGHFLPSAMFRQLAVLPHNRIVYRALFNRFEFQNFWCRDDYNSDHHMRSQELRRIGAKSYGIMHGIPSVCGILHQLRYLDFDAYFVAGSYQYEHYYKEKWPSHMEVRSIGSFGLTREEFWKLAEPREKNIAFFISPVFNEDKSFEAIGALAKAFPDKKLFINTKLHYTNKDTSYGRKLWAFLDQAPENVVLDKGSSYDLLFSCQYVFSDGSTLAAEAIQFGLDSYVFDFEPERWKVLNYRELPGVCVHSAEEAISRVKMAEEGNWSLARETFPQLIDLTGRIAWDQILWDMGLLSKSPNPLPHLAFTPS